MAQSGTDRGARFRLNLRGWEPDLRDVLAFVGTSLLALGAGMIYRPAAPIVLGVILLLLARPWAS